MTTDERLWTAGEGKVIARIWHQCRSAFRHQRPVNTVRLHPVNEIRLFDELAERHIGTPEMVIDKWVPDPVTGERLQVKRDPSLSWDDVIVEMTR